MKNSKVVIIMLIIMILFSAIVATPVYASREDVPDELRTGQAEGGFNANMFKPESTTEAQNTDKIGLMGRTITSVISIVGIIISVLAFSILGIKYMLGSVEEKADYKKSLVPYMTGAVILFGITTILRIIIEIVSPLG